MLIECQTDVAPKVNQTLVQRQATLTMSPAFCQLKANFWSTDPCSQERRIVVPTLIYCWITIYDGGTT